MRFLINEVPLHPRFDAVVGERDQLLCISFLRKGEVFAYVGRIHNLKDLKTTPGGRARILPTGARLPTSDLAWPSGTPSARASDMISGRAAHFPQGLATCWLSRLTCLALQGLVTCRLSRLMCLALGQRIPSTCRAALPRATPAARTKEVG